MPHNFSGDVVFGNDVSLFFTNADGTLKEWVRMGSDNSLTVINSSTLAVSLIPDATNTYDLGSVAKGYRDLHLTGNALIGGTLGVTGTTTLGVVNSGALTSTGTIRGTGLSIDGTNIISTYKAPAAFTPVPTGAAGDIVAQTSTGYWTQVGKIVQFTLTVAITDVGTATGDLTITLPAALPAAADISLDQALSCWVTNVTEAGVQIAAKIVTNTKTIQLYDIASDAGGAVTDIENGTFTVSGSYISA